jgi:hypothetical protein
VRPVVCGRCLLPYSASGWVYSSRKASTEVLFARKISEGAHALFVVRAMFRWEKLPFTPLRHLFAFVKRLMRVGQHPHLLVPSTHRSRLAACSKPNSPVCKPRRGLVLPAAGTTYNVQRTRRLTVTSRNIFCAGQCLGPSTYVCVCESEGVTTEDGGLIHSSVKFFSFLVKTSRSSTV